MNKNKSGGSGNNSRQKSPSSALQANNALEQERFRLTWLDYIIAGVVALGAGLWVFRYVGTSVNWDDLFYMNLSQYTTPQAWVLNRYGHIYLQKLFFWFAGDSILGGRVYWCFLFFGTCVLVYWCARMLAGKGGYIIGIIATLLFAAQPLFTRYVGCTLADFTVMFMIMLGTFVYLAFLDNKGKHRHLVIAILGFIFFWTMKSKETGLCMAVLFFGLGGDTTGHWHIRRFVKDMGWICVGIFAGHVLLMVLDLAFMGDILFSVRPSNVRELFAHNLKEFKTSWPIMTWYTYLSLQPLLAPALLYLLIGCKRNQMGFSRDKMILWLIPLGMLFLIQVIAVFRGHYHVDSRYFAAAIPGICVWAAQFFRFRLSGSLSFKKNRYSIARAPVALMLIVVAFIIVCVFMPKTADIAQSTRVKTSGQFYTNVIMPLSTTVLLIVASISRKRGLGALFLSSLCLLFILYSPLESNLTSLKQRTVAQKSEWRFEPYRVFADQLSFDKDVKILVSKDVHKRSWMLGRDVRSHCWMFNVFFNQESDYEQFIDGTWEDILKGDYTYAILTWRDWKGIGEKHSIENLKKDYTAKIDKRTQLILLKKI